MSSGSQFPPSWSSNDIHFGPEEGFDYQEIKANPIKGGSSSEDPTLRKISQDTFVNFADQFQKAENAPLDHSVKVLKPNTIFPNALIRIAGKIYDFILKFFSYITGQDLAKRLEGAELELKQLLMFFENKNVSTIKNGDTRDLLEVGQDDKNFEQIYLRSHAILRGFDESSIPPSRKQTMNLLIEGIETMYITNRLRKEIASADESRLLHLKTLLSHELEKEEVTDIQKIILTNLLREIDEKSPNLDKTLPAMTVQESKLGFLQNPDYLNRGFYPSSPNT